MRLFRELIILILAALAVVYLFLPSLLPDVVPLVGWLDEGLATTILLSALKHWGLDLTSLFGSPENVKSVDATTNQDMLVTQNGQTQKVRIPREVLERALRECQQEQTMQGK